MRLEQILVNDEYSPEMIQEYLVTGEIITPSKYTKMKRHLFFECLMKFSR